MSDSKRLRELRGKRKLAREKVKWFERHLMTHSATRRKRAAYMRATGDLHYADLTFILEKANRPTREEIKHRRQIVSWQSQRYA